MPIPDPLHRAAPKLATPSLPAHICTSSEFAVSLLLALADRGVKHFVVSPGSRSQALALAAAELEQAGIIELHVRIDERDAGFLALGIGMASGMPAAVITTSGSAVAHLLPSVMEASRTGIPMVLLTADRPAALRDTGANQTTHQATMFSAFAPTLFDVDAERYSTDPVSAADSLACKLIPSGGNQDRVNVTSQHHERSRKFVPGPVHANIQFIEPLSGPHTALRELRQELDTFNMGEPSGSALPPRLLAESVADGELSYGTASQAVPTGERSTIRVHTPNTVMIAGFRSDTAVAEAASRAGVPVVAEVTSGARGWHSVPNYREWLAAGADGRRTVVVSGLPNLSREVWAFASRPDVRLITVAQPGHEAFSPEHRAEIVSEVVFDGGAGSGWDPVLSERSEFSEHSDRAATPSRPYSSTGPQGSVGRDDVVDALWNASSGDDVIYVASSNMVRVADKRVGASTVPVYAHRGLAGIDGTIAAAIGVASGVAFERPTALVRLLIGDLAFAHDVGGLLLPAVEEWPRLQIVIVNDRGGHIFAGLEVAGSEPNLYERVVRTPFDLDFAKVAAAYGWDYHVARDSPALAALLTEARPGIIEIPMEIV